MKSSEYILKTSKEHAIYVCKNRAIPHIGDGLKHVQRMVLWVLRNRSEKIKTAALTGLLGYEKLHVHGEKSANDAIGLLAAPFKNNVCMVEGLGQFGSRVSPDKEGIGAPRYTEVRRAKAAELILYNDLDILELGENYDGSHKQPYFFLPYIPLVLLNGVSGVAVGYSTDILPYNLKDIINATKLALEDKEIPKLIPYFNNYDVMVESTEKENQWVFSGKVEIIDTSSFRITELPPGIKFQSFMKKLIKMEDDDLIQGFINSSTDKINIIIKMKRGSIRDWTEDTAIDFMKLREKTTERIVVLNWDGESVRTLSSPEELISEFVVWRLFWYSERYKKLIKDTKYELAYFTALKILFENGFLDKLGKFNDKKEMQEHILELLKNEKEYVIDNDQLNRIVNISTYHWTKEFRNEINAEIFKLNSDLTDYTIILNDKNKLKKAYMNDLNALSKAFKLT